MPKTKDANNTKLVIFDMDGTILDTLQDLTDSINHALDVNGYPIHTLEEVKSYVGNGRRKLVERAVPEGLSESEIEKVFNELVDYYPKNCANHTKPYDGIIELFQSLKERGIHIAVNSNKDDAEVKILANKYYGNLVDYCVGSFENVPKKPEPNGVHNIIEYFHVSKEESIYVGDSEVDVLTAIHSNVDAIIVDWGFREHNFLEKYIEKAGQEMNYLGNMKLVSTCGEIVDLLEKSEK